MFGSVLNVSRSIYSHYGVDHGDGLVFHLTGDRAKETSTAKVRISTREDFADGGNIELVSSPTPQQLEGFMTRATDARRAWIQPDWAQLRARGSVRRHRRMDLHPGGQRWVGGAPSHRLALAS